MWDRFFRRKKTAQPPAPVTQDAVTFPPSDDALADVRAQLRAEVAKDTSGGEREDDLALLCCVKLFGAGLPQDSLEIWRAKTAGFDLSCIIDVQLLCGAGLKPTKDWLRASADPASRDALSYIEECEAAGDFEDFSPVAYLAYYRRYFGG